MGWIRRASGMIFKTRVQVSDLAGHCSDRSLLGSIGEAGHACSADPARKAVITVQVHSWTRREHENDKRIVCVLLGRPTLGTKHTEVSGVTVKGTGRERRGVQCVGGDTVLGASSS